MPQPSDIIQRKFPFTPTQDQLQFFSTLDFLLDEGEDRRAVVLKGYAGTGKTTIVNALTKTLPLFNYKYLLLAPTGRAAKILNQYSGRQAFTIHKVMFKQVADAKQGSLEFKRQKNYSKNTVFIIDEASMISGEEAFGKPSLLTQVINYIFEKSSNRLLIIGDDAQLPPVGVTQSAGLDIKFLKQSYQLNLKEVMLREVIRQKQDSGILYNATYLREQLSQKEPKIKLEIGAFKDTYRMTGERLEDGLRYAYDKYGMDQSMIITRSNKSAVQYNRYIRHQLLFYESEIEAGDRLMIARNNYYYLDPESAAGFLANGDFIEVMKIRGFEDLHGFRFADLEVRLIDYPDEPFEVKVILDTLYAESPALSAEKNKSLYESIAQDYVDLVDEKELGQAIRQDPFYNALQVKFAYALTCHKSQGGQWKAVFVDQGYLTDEMINREYLRWLYTAVTRSSEELFFLNFHPKFFIG